MRFSSISYEGGLPDMNKNDLRKLIKGAVFAPGDSDYENARWGWNRAINAHPVCIVEPTSASDVEIAVRFASEHGLTVAVKATGHGICAPFDNALLIKHA
jgi:FAD/FMN-containing dehydrogenase